MITSDEPMTPTSIAVNRRNPSRTGSFEKMVGSGSTS